MLNCLQVTHNIFTPSVIHVLHMSPRNQHNESDSRKKESWQSTAVLFNTKPGLPWIIYALVISKSVAYLLGESSLAHLSLLLQQMRWELPEIKIKSCYSLHVLKGNNFCHTFSLVSSYKEVKCQLSNSKVSQMSNITVIKWVRCLPDWSSADITAPSRNRSYRRSKVGWSWPVKPQNPEVSLRLSYRSCTMWEYAI